MKYYYEGVRDQTVSYNNYITNRYYNKERTLEVIVWNNKGFYINKLTKSKNYNFNTTRYIHIKQIDDLIKLLQEIKEANK